MIRITGPGKMHGGALLQGGAPGERDVSPEGKSIACPGEAGRERKPVIVWNITSACNLKCKHCYSNSVAGQPGFHMPFELARDFVAQLKELAPPLVLLSGGEPLLYPKLMEIVRASVDARLKVSLSTNGTLITPDVARDLKGAGVGYVGISLDGIGEVNDAFRGVKGAFEQALRGFRSCQEAGLKVGLRLTMVRSNVGELERVFDFLEAERIPRACFYHLCYAGRGRGLFEEALSRGQTRGAITVILGRALDLHGRGALNEVLTVGNHADGPFIYLKLKDEDEKLATRALQVLRRNGGALYSSGVGICSVDWRGDVHPDQFWLDYSLGNIKERSFKDIWYDESEPLLRGLRRRREYIKGRCSSRACKWFDICGGSMRVRANAVFKDPWAPDPGCYLTNEEIGLDEAMC